MATKKAQAKKAPFKFNKDLEEQARCLAEKLLEEQRRAQEERLEREKARLEGERLEREAREKAERERLKLEAREKALIETMRRDVQKLTNAINYMNSSLGALRIQMLQREQEILESVLETQKERERLILELTFAEKSGGWPKQLEK